MKDRDKYTLSELVIHEKGNWWTGMIDLPRGESPLVYAEMRLEESPFIKEISIYRNGRFVRSVRRAKDLIGTLPDERY
jgi:hypothetical protein